MTIECPLLLGLYGAGLMIRKGYELLKRAGKLDGSNRIVFAVVFVAGLVGIASIISWQRLEETALESRF
jgi:uncharacterized membrane protein